MTIAITAPPRTNAIWLRVGIWPALLRLLLLPSCDLALRHDALLTLGRAFEAVLRIEPGGRQESGDLVFFGGGRLNVAARRKRKHAREDPDFFSDFEFVLAHLAALQMKKTGITGPSAPTHRARTATTKQHIVYLRSMNMVMAGRKYKPIGRKVLTPQALGREPRGRRR